MTCKCICGCKTEIDSTIDVKRWIPEMCLACNLCDSLGSSKHGLPYTPATIKPLDPEVAITDEQKNEALENAVTDGIG